MPLLSVSDIFTSDMSLCVAFLVDLTSVRFFQLIWCICQRLGVTFHALIGVITWTFKHFCPMETEDDSRVNHPSRFKALLPCYGKQMGFHHIGT